MLDNHKFSDNEDPKTFSSPTTEYLWICRRIHLWHLTSADYEPALSFILLLIYAV